jgi:hypothetical protein
MALFACADQPDSYNSNAHAVSDLTIQVSASADVATGSGIKVVALVLGAREDGRQVELRLGGEDILVATIDGRETELQYMVPDYQGYFRDGAGQLEVVFVRGGQRAAVPVPLAKPFTVVASPSQFAIGDKVVIDVSPRPVLSKETTLELVPESCVGSLVRIFVTELPFVWDTSALKRDLTVGIDLGTAQQRCPVRLTTVVETVGAKPFASGIHPLRPETTGSGRRTVRSELEVRP